MATVGAIVVGAGRSERMSGADKVFASLDGRPLLAYSVAAFAASRAVHFIVVVLHERNLERGRALIAEGRWRKVVAVVPGGERRQDSVRAGLAALPPCDLVAVHDAARPLVTTDLIRRGVEVAAQTGAAIAAMPVKDTIKRVGDGGRIVATPPREQLWAAQTPQLARRDLLERAFALADERGLTVTDEAGLLEAAGEPVTVFAGSYRNLKITTPEDLAIAAVLLGVAG
ncbi:MAG TPA: 2-C-methyl-D-erythritol 4-phosphate cytidylyltransferase [Thermomicrobiales bacterium]|nr:2-C-methyl-D-erythritol 4-phosphate cytidylyltransferase [Thermomicrobiales bacterium]